MGKYLEFSLKSRSSRVSDVEHRKQQGLRHNMLYCVAINAIDHRRAC